MCLVLTAFSAAALILFAYLGSMARTDPRVLHRVAAVVLGKPPEAPRPIYRYSVIPGGVYTAGELARAVARDAVVAGHYADFDIARARVVKLDRDRRAYVSFRVRNAVYWTKRPVNLRRGEQVLTDGRTLARTRCGNRMAEAPQLPITAEEPPPEGLDSLGVPEPPVLAGAPPEQPWSQIPAAPRAPEGGGPPPIAEANAKLFDLLNPEIWNPGGPGGWLGPGGTSPVTPPAGPGEDTPAQPPEDTPDSPPVDVVKPPAPPADPVPPADPTDNAKPPLGPGPIVIPIPGPDPVEPPPVTPPGPPPVTPPGPPPVTPPGPPPVTPPGPPVTPPHNPPGPPEEHDDPPPIPEPGTWALIGSGLLIAAGLQRRRAERR